MEPWRGVFGFPFGVMSGPLGPDISGPRLVAAVSNAGALGFLRAPDWDDDPEFLRGLINQTRELTDRPFGVGIVLAFEHENHVKVILEERVPFLQVNWGNVSKELVDRAHAVGTQVLSQIGDLAGARHAIEAGVDGIVVQGREGGGHINGQEGLIWLVPLVADLVKGTGIIVIASGGIMDARGYTAALALGAQGVSLGTRFVATEESFAHPRFKELLVEKEKTEYTTLFGRNRWPNGPCRVLAMGESWRALPPNETELDRPVIGETVINGRKAQIRLFAGTCPNATTTGEIEKMVLYAGQGVSIIKEILPAAEVIREMVGSTQQYIKKRRLLSLNP